MDEAYGGGVHMIHNAVRSLRTNSIARLESYWWDYR